MKSFRCDQTVSHWSVNPDGLRRSRGSIGKPPVPLSTKERIRVHETRFKDRQHCYDANDS